MPMEASYFDSMKSSVADMKNSGGRMGGAISASLFLKQFVNEGVEWAHLDIAGPVWDESAGVATGFGANMLAEWASAHGRK
jgi:leucyl aminopeptidase